MVGAVSKKICSSCGEGNSPRAKACFRCQKTRFEPAWVLAKRSINRQLSVQITLSNPNFGKSEKRITLSKWWPGGRAAFHFLKVSQWQEVARIIDQELGPILGWAKVKSFVSEAKTRAKDERTQTKELASLVTDHPDFLKKPAWGNRPEKTR